MTAVGLGLLAFLILHIGPRAILLQLTTLRISLPLLIVIGLLRLGLQSWNWSMALSADGVSANPLQLAGVRLASNSLSYLSAMGPVVAEPAKLVLLRNKATASESAPATLAETAIYWFTSVLLGLSGILAGSVLLTRGSHGASALWICGAIFLAAMPLLLSRRSLLGRLGVVISRWRNPLPSWFRKGEEIEDRVRSFRIRHPQVAGRIFLLDLLSQFLMVMEVFVVLRSLGIRADFLTMLAIEAVTRAFKMASIWVPGRLGIDESGAAGACALFGMSPAAGLTLSLARRARDLLWCFAGLVWLGCSGPRKRISNPGSIRLHAAENL